MTRVVKLRMEPRTEYGESCEIVCSTGRTLARICSKGTKIMKKVARRQKVSWAALLRGFKFVIWPRPTGLLARTSCACQQHTRFTGSGASGFRCYRTTEVELRYIPAIPEGKTAHLKMVPVKRRVK